MVFFALINASGSNVSAFAGTKDQSAIFRSAFFVDASGLGSGATHELDLPSILSLVSSPVDWAEPLKINPHRPGEYQQA